MSANAILVVDDHDVNRQLLCRMFSDIYTVLEAVDGEDAIRQLKQYGKSLSAVLLDIVMPKVDGFGVMEYMKKEELLEQIPVILITGDSSSITKERAFNMGASDLIEKPFDAYVVRRRIKNLVDLYFHKNRLEELVSDQTEKIKEQNQKLSEMNYRIIDTLGTIVEFRDLESGQHILRVREFTRELAKCVAKCYPEYQLDDEKTEIISYASAMHDVGKIAIPDRILLKAGKLTMEEFAIMKSHTLKGCEIVEHVSMDDDTTYMKYCYEIARSHHEKYDGNGYPDGLSGENIPIAAQIVSVADVYDALVSERIYKEAYSFEDAYHMILNGDCGVFNPKLMACFKIVHVEFERMAKQLR